MAAGRKRAPRAAVPPRESPNAVEGVEADLLGLPASPAGSGLAASALALARSIDDSGTSATARAACVRALMVTMRELCSLVRRERRWTSSMSSQLAARPAVSARICHVPPSVASAGADALELCEL